MIFRFSTTLILTLVLASALSGCRYDEDTFLKPQVQHHSGIPLAYGQMKIPTLLPDTFIESNIDGTLQFVYEQEFSSKPLEDLITLPAITQSVSFFLEELSMPDQVLDFSFSLGEVVKGTSLEYLIYSNVGLSIPFPELFNQTIKAKTFTLEEIDWITLSQGEMSLNLINNLPVDLVDFKLDLVDPDNGEPLVTFEFPKIITGEQASQKLDIIDLTLPGKMSYIITLSLAGSGGNPVSIDTSSKGETTSYLNKLKASAGRMVVPSQTITQTDILTLESSGNSEVSFLSIKEGLFSLEVVNDFGIPMASTIKFNSVKKGQTPLAVVLDLPAAGSDPSTGFSEINLAEFGVNLLNEELPGSASFPFSFEMIVNPLSEMVSFDLLKDRLNVTSILNIQKFEKIEGELDYDPVKFESSQKLPIESVLGSLTKGTIELTDVSFGIDFENTAGIEGIIDLDLTSVNAQTGEKVKLTGATSFNLKRALDFPLAPAADNGFELNAQNSNIGEVISNFPTEFESKITVRKPEGGEKYDDFLYANSAIKAKLWVKAPLSFIMNDLTLMDTFDFKLDVPKEAKNLNQGELIIQALNGFPLGITLVLDIVNQAGESLDILTTTENSILAAPVDQYGKVVQVKNSEFLIPLDNTTYQKIKDASQIRVKAILDSDGKSITFYDNYDFGFRLLADLIFDY
ncbi:MAG: hypothetical protein ACJATA_001977 [Sphingobacteriales bacterium]|jgi:hypothetical protein